MILALRARPKKQAEEVSSPAFSNSDQLADRVGAYGAEHRDVQAVVEWHF
jgi:hypothetical protein